jgi:hypothetical protein
MAVNQIDIILYALFGVIGIQSLMLIFVIWKTPALIFLKASLFKQPVMYIIGKDHLGYFKTFSPKNGAAYIRSVGLFNLTENSHTLEAGAKIPIYFAFRDLAATLLPEYPAIIQELRESGFIVNNLDDVKLYLRKIREGLIEDFPVKIKPYKTYKFHDLANMFPFNLDPTFIDSTVQCEVSKFTKMMKVGPLAVGTLVIVILAVSLGVFIILRATKGNIGIEECRILCEAGKSVVTTAVTSVPINAVPLA